MIQSKRQTSALWLLCSAAFLFVLLSSTTRTEKSSSCSLLPLAQAFVPLSTLSPKRRFQKKLYGTKDVQQKQEAQFEYQELVAQLDEMLSRNIPMTRLTPQKQQELQQYTRAVATKRISSSVPSSDNLQSTSWKLVFSTQSLLATELPADATVGLEFLDASTLNYNLDFGKKTFGLNKLTAKSQYTIDNGPINTGLLTFSYDEITTDVFGLSNLPVGFFGLLKGRSNTIETCYFDGKVWIERGFDPLNNGEEYFNVYSLQE